MIDSDYDALELVKSVVALIEAKDFDTIEGAFNRTIDAARSITRMKYGELADERVRGVIDELHDDRVQAQGGI